MKEPPPHELLYVDLQADEGGGSWAEAKIQTLEKCPGWTATHPMEIEEIISTLKFLGDDDLARLIDGATLYAELDPNDIKRMVDVENGPGLAPGFGGIKIPYRCHYMEAGAGMADETGTVLIGFSGGAQWQDLQFALAVARAMRDCWNDKKDESLTMNFAPLKEYPEIEFWMQNLGLR